MTIQEMHTTFRTLGQQAGMQLIRAVLPESIDVFINKAINEKVRSVIMSNSQTPFNDRVAIQDNSISPINSIRTLVKQLSLDVPSLEQGNDFYVVPVVADDIMFYTSFGVRYLNVTKRKGARFIENDKLDNTREDYCNRESWDAPIITMFADNSSKEYLNLYVDSVNKIPNKVEVNYIKLPRIVKHSSSVNCDLPIYTHDEIVSLAVDKFFISVGITTKPVTNK